MENFASEGTEGLFFSEKFEPCPADRHSNDSELLPGILGGQALDDGVGGVPDSRFVACISHTTWARNASGNPDSRSSNSEPIGFEAELSFTAC
jgi:hypothetical protein